MSFDNQRNSDAVKGSEQGDLPKLDVLSAGGVGDSSSHKALEEMRKSLSRPTALGFAPVSIFDGGRACAT